MFRRFAQDQEYLEELQAKGRGWKFLYMLWDIFADCGRTIHRWALWSVGIALWFGVIFYMLGSEHFYIGELEDKFSTYIYYGLVNFVSLGTEEFYPLTDLGKWYDLIEIIFGYVMLGGLIAILMEKIARRS